jgi:hypothetical protein
MRSVTGLISILITAAIGIYGYMYFLKQASPGPGMVVTQNISVVGVKNDLIAIAQAERMYYLQNNSYADLATLASSGTMNITRTGRDGYTYAVDSSGSGFTVTATYTPPPLDMPPGTAPPHFPTYTIDQTMEVHQGD